ncbi:MAG TPA: hypothetical protein VFH51_17505, partial [Myxococcota bacterium]|nr:hypothetical protein [Myxococcota bacterium]
YASAIDRVVSQLFHTPERMTSEAVEEPRPVKTAASAPEEPVAEVSVQAAQITFATSDSADPVIIRVKTPQGVLACDAPVSYLTPCTLRVPAGPLIVHANDSEAPLTVAPGANLRYQPDFSLSPGFLGWGVTLTTLGGIGTYIGGLFLIFCETGTAFTSEDGSCGHVVGAALGGTAVLALGIGLLAGGPRTELEPITGDVGTATLLREVRPRLAYGAAGRPGLSAAWRF